MAGSADHDDRYDDLTWARFGEAVKELASDIARSGYQPDIILAIARGGLVPAGALGYLLAPPRAAPPSHRAAMSRSGSRAQARNGAAAVSMGGSAPVPLQPRPTLLR